MTSLIVAVDYFTKWVEAKAVATTTSARIKDFVQTHIFCRFGIPSAIISDNGVQFCSKEFTSWCAEKGIMNKFASVAHPQSNGQVEVTNRTIVDGIKKKLASAKGKWAELLDEVLWAYRVTPRAATKRSPYEMTFGMEAMTPVEMLHNSPRVVSYAEDENLQTKQQKLDELEDLRMEARLRIAEFQRRMRSAFNKKIAPRHFQPGDLVLRKVEATGKRVGKLDPTWEGPFKVVRSYEGRAYKLEEMDGKLIPRTWGIEHLRSFYV